MLVFQCGLAVLVSTSEGSRSQNILRMTLKVAVMDDVLTFGRVCQIDKLLILTQPLLLLILLNDD